MHILYEAELLGSLKHIGISNCILQLIQHISLEDTFISVCHKLDQKIFKEYQNIIELKRDSLLSVDKPFEILHSFTLKKPLTKGLPHVQSIFDTIIEHYPETLRDLYPKIDEKISTVLKNTAKALAQETPVIIAPSQNTKKDLMNIYHIPENKIKVIPLAPDPFFHRQSPEHIWNFKKKYSISFPYFLFVGPRWKYKNFNTLLKAFSILKNRVGIEHQAIKLVAVGSTTELSEDEKTIISTHSLENEVIFLPFVSLPNLNLWYNAALALVYPSLYEGFGLPPLEAMSCGTPVLASNSSSIPEVIGNAALSFEPHNAEQCADMMCKIVYDTSLSDKLRHSGLDQLQKFNWKNIAKETLSLYENVIKKQNSTN